MEDIISRLIVGCIWCIVYFVMAYYIYKEQKEIGIISISKKTIIVLIWSCLNMLLASIAAGIIVLEIILLLSFLLELIYTRMGDNKW